QHVPYIVPIDTSLNHLYNTASRRRKRRSHVQIVHARRSSRQRRRRERPHAWTWLPTLSWRWIPCKCSERIAPTLLAASISHGLLILWKHLDPWIVCIYVIANGLALGDRDVLARAQLLLCP